MDRVSLTTISIRYLESRLTLKADLMWPRDSDIGISRGTSLRVADHAKEPTHRDTPVRIIAIATCLTENIAMSISTPIVRT